MLWRFSDGRSWSCTSDASGLSASEDCSRAWPCDSSGCREDDDGRDAKREIGSGDGGATATVDVLGGSGGGGPDGSSRSPCPRWENGNDRGTSRW